MFLRYSYLAKKNRDIVANFIISLRSIIYARVGLSPLISKLKLFYYYLMYFSFLKFLLDSDVVESFFDKKGFEISVSK